jgi:hypothetical protein
VEDTVDINRSAFVATAPRETRTAGDDAMDDLHITIEPERIVTPTLILRSWSAEGAQGAFEIYGDPRIAKAIGGPQPVRDVAEMRELSGDWNLRSSQSPVPQGLREVEAADDGQLLDPASLQSARCPACDGDGICGARVTAPVRGLVCGELNQQTGSRYARAPCRLMLPSV